MRVELEWMAAPVEVAIGHTSLATWKGGMKVTCVTEHMLRMFWRPRRRLRHDGVRNTRRGQNIL